MKIIDLTKKIYTNMPVYPADPEVKFEKHVDFDTHSWQVHRMEMGSHTGTHVDAFSHMHEGAPSIDAISLDHFIGSAQLVDVDDAVFPIGIGLLFDAFVDLPVLERIVAAKPLFVAGDLSVALERELLGMGIVTYTDLVNLDQLPKGEKFLFVGLPLALVGLDGSPVRAVAILDK
ncbi:cyclase family protein [Fundicoccus sp. Sow4_H7]|uniref:cyclase family protein n=1 Tax=Fundicoccus sp. Sow4_H7 TaxID=3438784 RepID=UPI003F93384D